MLRRLTVALIAMLLVAGLRPPVAHAYPQRFTIAVGRSGFANSVEYTLNVEAGHEVTLTFTYADTDLADDNPHEIKIKGAGLEMPTVTVSRDHPTASITFTPTRAGTLRIICMIPCLGMENLAGGVINVVKPRATGAPVSLTLDLTPRDDGNVLARATLLDTSGNPLADAPVIFTRHTSLGGDLVLGTPTTIQNGSAVVKIPTTGSEKLKITAAFEGGGGLAYAEASNEIVVPGAPMLHRPGALAAPTAPPALVIALVIVLGGVWATYGFVVYQVARIRRA